MTMPVKIGVGIGAIAAAIGACFYFFKGKGMIEVADKLDISLLKMPQVHNFEGLDMVIAVPLKLDNPTSGRIDKLQLRQFYLYYNGKQVGKSKINSTLYTIPAVSSAQISNPPVYFTVPILSNISTIADLLTGISTSEILSNPKGCITKASANLSKVMSKMDFKGFISANGIDLEINVKGL